MSADGGSRRSVGVAATGAVLVGGIVYIADSGPLWPGLALLAVLAAALAGGLLARRPRDVLALGAGAFAGVWLAGVARGLEPGSPGDAALLGLVPAAFFGALVLAAGYAVFALLLAVRGRVRRLAAAAVIGTGLALAWVALLSGTSPAPVQSYRVVDPQTIVVVVGGAPHGWTRVSGVAESASTVAVSAQTTTWLPGPGTASLELVELTVRLAQPLDGRTVTDGSGQAVPVAAGP
jgi:hypothetical protein